MNKDQSATCARQIYDVKSNGFGIITLMFLVMSVIVATSIEDEVLHKPMKNFK